MVAYEKKVKHTQMINTFYTEIILLNYIGEPSCIRIFPYLFNYGFDIHRFSNWGVLILLNFILVHSALIAFLIALQWKCENLLSEIQSSEDHCSIRVA